jgi:hypothetical protein
VSKGAFVGCGGKQCKDEVQKGVGESRTEVPVQAKLRLH